MLVGDAFARPLVEAFDALDPPLDAPAAHRRAVGGAVLSPSVKAAWVDRLPETLLIDGFGASESGGQGQSVSAAGGPIERTPRFRVNDETCVVDDEFRPVGPGVVGKLARSGHVPVGYYKDPGADAATFPTINGVRWAVPGDHARVEDDGTITVLGRGSVSINTGGEKVYPEEVESVLKSHPAVFDAVVVGIPDERWGERVAAVVQTRRETTVTLDELGEHVRGQLAAYKAPRELVLVDAIARSPSGKPDYRWARATPWSDRRRPSTGRRREAMPGKRDGYGAPHGPEPPRARDQPVPPPARRQPGRLVPVGRRRRSTGPAPTTSRSSCRSGTRRATGATSWRTSRSRTPPSPR